MKLVLAIVAAIVGIAVAAGLSGMWRWKRQTAEVTAQLHHAGAAGTYRESALVDLPPPVQRYFRKVLKDGQPLVRTAVTMQDAEFFINGGWRPLRATQHFRASPPAFVWDANITMAPLMPALVRDSYVDGRAAMRASLYGVWSLVDQSGLHELNLGALQRFLGETVWIPTALLPSAAVTWQPRDDRSAVATLHDGGNTVSLLFEFDDTGMVRAISGDRFKEVGGSYVMQRWEIACGEPAEHGGMVIPTRCEVAWVNGGAREPYWRGRISTIRYEY
ncbi:MAG TPA: DUF6544 family protein [Vicinamibacterales bacterium]|nr:DUF6544 family protein [Vicinamibacterales bacterium]